MDPSVVKKLLEDDEDETMHSGADLLAFQAALNKDIEGDVSASQPSDSDTAVLCQGSNNTSSQSLLQLSIASQDENTAGQIQQDQKIAQHRELHLYEMEPKQQGSIAENMQQKNDASKVLNHFPLPQKQPHGDLQEGQAEQKPLQIPETTGMLISEKHPSSTEEHGIAPNLKSESQYLKLQKMSSQQSMITEQPRNPSNQSRQVVFYQLYPLLLPQLNKDRGRQLTTLFGRLKPSPNHRLLPKASVPQQPPRMLSISAGAAQLTNPRSSALHLRGPNSATDPSHSLPSTVQVQTDSSHPLIKNSARKLPEAECHSDSEGMQVSQISSSSVVATNQERECFSVPMHGNAGGTCHLFSGTSVNTCALPVKPQPSDAQLRQVLQHQSIGSTQSGGEARGANIMSVSKTERQNSMNEPSRLQEQSSRPVSSMAYVKQELIDQTAEQQHKPPLPSSHGLPSVSAGVLEQGNASSVISMDESLEKQPSRMGVSSSPSSSTITVPQSSVSPSFMMQVNPSVSLGPRISSGTSPCGINNKTPPKKPSIGRKKPLEALGSSPPQSSKKQKVSGAFSDIEQLNDVTAVSGVNLREEEEQLFPGPKEDSRASEASRKSVQKEEERLILEKAPLQKKLAEIMVKCGLKSVTHDVERCLSLCVEERMRGLINNLIRLSKQRVDAEKSRHHTITNSDVRQQIMDLNQKAREEWEKKQAGAEKIRRLNEPEVDNGVDGDEEKDESHPKSFKTNIEADGKLRTTAANVAARAAVGGDDMFSKWQLMAQARQKHEGEIDAASGSQPGKDVNHKPTSTTGRIMKGSQEAEKRGGPAPVARAGPIRKSGRNQVIMPQTRMARTISVKDMIAALEREPQMSKSMLIYRLHERIQS
ncbi:hypothetical protein PRUPE_6G138300 [Prunus persica]|uniref:Transcription initiation factor TFIID component TAF4 C-terminal domain-containing protein n=1 Tax=Prunus persica TaxID=3760 RepID=A0A251NQ36_PRUPE|nr:hypothetical protein PRUPE_6G138300 [Prunus persica]